MKNNFLDKVLTGCVLLMGFLIATVSVHAAVEGDIYQWQLKKYGDLPTQFSDVIEKQTQNEQGVRDQSAEDLYHWQLKKYEWSNQEFDYDSLR